MNYSTVLNYLYPDKAWSVLGNTYEGIDWQDDSPKPSKKELEAAWSEANVFAERDVVRAARQRAFEQFADPLFFKFQAGEATKQEWLDARAVVVEQYPYPEEA
jgi:hypothetical protein